MTYARWHLAQLNVGRLVAPLAASAIDGFRAQLDPINALADAHPGLVWRLQTEAGNATDIRPTEDDLFLINMSVWRSIDALRLYLHHSPCAGAPPSPCVVRAARGGASRAVVGPGRSHPDDRGGDGSSRPTPPSWTDPLRLHVPDAVRARFGATDGLPGRRRVLLAGVGRLLTAASLPYRPGCQSGSSTPRSWFS